MTQWIEMLNRKQDGTPVTRRIKIPEIGGDVWFTDNGYAEVSNSVADLLASNIDAIQKVAAPSTPGTYYGDEGSNVTVKVVGIEDGEFDNATVFGLLDAGSISTDKAIIGDSARHFSATKGDTQSIRNAISEAKAATGPTDAAVVWVPPGVYDIGNSSPIVLDGDDASYITVRGFGMATKFRIIDDTLQGNDGGGVLKTAQDSNGNAPTQAGFDNIFIDGEGHVATAPGWLRYGTDVFLRRIYATNIDTRSASLSGGWIDLGGGARRGVIEDCVAWVGSNGTNDSGQGLIHAHGITGDVGHIRRCIAIDAVDQATVDIGIQGFNDADGHIEDCTVIRGQLDVYGGTTAENCTVNDTPSGMAAVRLYGEPDAIEGCTIRDAGVGINVRGNPAVIRDTDIIDPLGNGIENVSGGLTLNSVTVRNAGGTGIIGTAGGDGTRLLNVTVEGSTGDNIRFESSSNPIENWEFSGVRSVDSGKRGILLIDGGNPIMNVKIRDSQAYDTRASGSKTQTYGVYIDASTGSGTDVTIKDTNLEGNATGPYTETGSPSVTFQDNDGFVTEAKGTAIVSTGTTSTTVSHGLDRAPAKEDILLTPTSNLGSATWWKTETIGASTFDIVVDADPTTDVEFVWVADV